ncbi:G-protein coupled receptor moody-like [Patiria miniata]|uniref:G-protein coupled receptors family 1 profile domain-containing protein n=1 Tax=Patiria miniata TaxID=46514 RepID=A0A914A8Z6_PATMI|nr:G-protein coupled receptor moody-like [Patiria miniata]
MSFSHYAMDSNMDSYQFANSSTAPTSIPSQNSDSFGERVGVTVYVGLLAVVGFVGNILVIVSVAISPRLRTTSYAFIVNLSVADLLINVFVIPAIGVSFFDYGWPHDIFWCRWLCYLFLLCVGVSLLTVTDIAASRYCFVSRPRQTYRKYFGCKSVAIILIHNWFVALLFIFIHSWSGISGIQYHPVLRFCFLKDSGNLEFWYINFIMIYFLATCFVLIPCLYCLTFRTLYLSQRRVRRQTAPRSRGSFGHWRQILHPAEVKLTKMMALIFILLVLCFTPVSIMHFFIVDPIYQRLGVVLLLTNSSLNPFVYAWLNTHFKKAYKRILLCGKGYRGRVKPLVV